MSKAGSSQVGMGNRKEKEAEIGKIKFKVFC